MKRRSGLRPLLQENSTPPARREPTTDIECYHSAIAFPDAEPPPKDPRDDLPHTHRAAVVFADIEALVLHLGGAVEEREGSRVKLVLRSQAWRCHRPHPGKEANRYQVEEAREFLRRAGVEA